MLTKKPSKNEIILNGYKVHQAKEKINIGSTGFSIDALFKFHQLAKQADIIHHHYPHPFGDILQIFSLITKPYIVTYHSDIIRQKNLENNRNWLGLMSGISISFFLEKSQ